MLYTEEKDGEKWITISHQHVKIDGDGNIIAGLGGKFNGKPVQHAIDHLTSQNKSSKSKAASKEKVDKPKSKMQHATEMIKNASPDTLAKDIKKQLADKLGLSPAAASTYYHNIKKKLAAQTEKEKPEEKKPVEKSSGIDFPEEHVDEVADLIKDNSESHTPGMIIGHVKDWYKISEKSATELYNKALAKVKGATSAPKKTYKDVVDKVEGKTSKAKQAEQIYNQMLGDKSKEVKDAFVKKLGISPATASTYYHNIKKKVGESPAPEDNKSSKKSDLDHAIDIVSKMKKDGQTGTDIIIAVSKKFGISHDDAIKLAISANDVLLDKEAEEFKKKNATPKPSISSDDIHDILSNSYSAGKDAVIKKIKDTFGLNNGDAVAHFDNVHSDWVDKKAKKEIPIIAKNYLQKNAAEPIEYIKKAYMIDDDHAKDVMQLYNSVLGDIIAGSSKLSVSGLKNKIQSKYPSLDDTPATDLADVIKKYYNGQVSWDDVGNTFWNIHDKKTLSGHKDYEMSQNEKELKALEIYKNMPNATASEKTMALVKHLKISSSEAIDLAIKADKVVAKQKTYQDIKNKVESSSSGAKIHYNHGEDASIPVPEHVEKFRSRVKVAKDINAHQAMDPHDHILKKYSDEYNKAPKSKKALTDAVYAYTGSDYHEINGSLRRKTDLGWHKDTVKALDKVFKHPSAKIKKETIVYRGYTSKIVNNLEAGDIFEDNGYMSTTSEEYKAENWAHSGGAVMHIILPEGANAISARPYSQFTSEHEVLINRGAKIRIIEKVVKKGEYEDQITFYAEYIVDKKKK